MGRPLRVLHVVVNMNRGGAETLIMNLYRNIDRSTVQFDFLTCKEGVFDQEIEELGGVVHRIPYITDVGHRGYVHQLQQFFNNHREYRMVHSHMDKMSGLVLRAAKRENIPVRIAHSHNTSSEGSFFSKAYKWSVGNYIKSSATHLYACSLTAAEWLFKKHAYKACILKNGIEMEKFRFSENRRKVMKQELNLSNNTFTIGHVGRFTQQKNHSFLIDCFARLHQVMPHTNLLLVGDGPLKKEIETKIRELGLEGNVQLLGTREDIHHVLQAMDLFMFPSLHEGMPVTLIEAQCSGLPCVISNVITKEVDLGNQLIQYVPLIDKDQWVQTMCDVINRRPSREGKVNSLDDKGYDIRKTAIQIEEAYVEMGEEPNEVNNNIYSYL